MTPSRPCSRTACGEAAIATLTYVYGDRAAALGPLFPAPEPHGYDLCPEHAARLTAPRGWEVVRHGLASGTPAIDDLEALADAVREPLAAGPDGDEGLRRGHLRMLR